MRGLTAFITDLLGNHLAHIGKIPAPAGGNQTNVKAEMNGARTASVRISAADRTAIGAVQARPMTRMLKVYYAPPSVEEGVLVFWGLAGRPVASMSGRVLTVRATDPTLRARRAFSEHLGAPGGAEGVTIDGGGVEAIWTQIVDQEAAIGCPTAGVVAAGGRHGPDVPGVKAAISTGQSFQDYIDTLSDAIDGPDWELRPLDTTFGAEPEGMSTAAWEALRDSTPLSAFYAQLHTYDRMGNDLRDTIHFDFGTGVENLAELEVETAGDQTVNIATVGVTGSEEGTSSASALDFASIMEIGIYGSQSSLSIDASAAGIEDVANDTAEAQVDAYAHAPIFLTLEVKKDELARFYPWHNYALGDYVTVGGESGAILLPYQGAWVNSVPARVTAIELQQDPEGRVTQNITVVVGDAEED